MNPPARTTTVGRHEHGDFRVLIYCDEHLDEDVGLAELAAIGGFSPYHFHRVFREVVGETPKAYLRRLRLERAVYRLKASPDQVIQIAEEVAQRLTALQRSMREAGFAGPPRSTGGATARPGTRLEGSRGPRCAPASASDRA